MGRGKKQTTGERAGTGFTQIEIGNDKPLIDRLGETLRWVRKMMDDGQSCEYVLERVK